MFFSSLSLSSFDALFDLLRFPLITKQACSDNYQRETDPLVFCHAESNDGIYTPEFHNKSH